jgi:hypothetical protein
MSDYSKCKINKYYDQLECWSFAWSNGQPRPYITRISAYTRQELIEKTSKEMDMSWKKIYKRGGRAIKTVTFQKR